MESRELIAGVDEAGRGPLAGPVAAAAVILDPACLPLGLRDSKLLTEAAREKAFAEVMTKAAAVSFCLLPPAEIDRLNIRGATLEAMRRAVAGLSIAPHRVIIDGRDVPPGLPMPGRAIIGGDATVAEISAASILAKTVRDAGMLSLHAVYPDYGFDRHKGYGTEAHLSALHIHGPCPAHRRSFAPVRAAMSGRMR